MAVLVGRTVSHYKILEHLGGGGMGVVYKAQDLKLDRLVALKFLPPALTRDAEARERFILEAKSASALDHPNICTIHHLGETDDGQSFIVMACYEGETLQRQLTRGPLAIDDAITLAIQLASGLAVAHKGGIVHRDIKPGNVIVTRDGTAKIIDFGLAILAGRARITHLGSLIGTAMYMSPEQARGEEVDSRTDIWSLGVMLYEMLAGKSPFAAEHEQAILYRILNEDPEPLTMYRHELSFEMQRIVDRMLQKNRVERYASALELLDDLRPVTSGSGVAVLPQKPLASIAVLPFEDLSPERDQEYFCDGVAEELINALARVDGLRVVSRTSSFSFKGQRKDLRAIGRQLGVETLLEGSVRQAHRRLRITVQLTSVRDASSLWSERYDRDLGDIFAVQDDVCVSIVEHLKVTLGHAERNNLVRRRARDHNAYNLFLRGRFLFNQRRHESVAKSIEYYSQAVALDPSFALAYAGLAESYEVLGSWRDIPLESAFAEARTASNIALRLDDRLPEAHVTAGYVSLFCDWNWTAAEREFQRALTLNPRCAEAHHMRAHYLEMMGKFDLALSEMNRAIELEPVMPSLCSCTAQVLYHARRYDEAIRQAYATLEMAPGFYGLHGWIGAAYVQSGLLKSGMAALEEGLRHLPDDPRLQALFGAASAISGNTDSARASLAKLGELSGVKYVDPYYTAWILESMGDRIAACESLAKAYDQHSAWLPWLSVDPLFDNLRDDPRAVNLLDRLGLHPKRDALGMPGRVPP